jgi:hypothetical protein
VPALLVQEMGEHFLHPPLNLTRGRARRGCSDKHCAHDQQKMEHAKHEKQNTIQYCDDNNESFVHTN